MRSIAALFTNLIFMFRPSHKPGQAHDYQAERKKNASVRVPKLPSGVKMEEFELNGLPAERISRQGNDKGWILYIHGGGFTTGSARERRMLTQYVADRHGYNCIAVNYRLSPENRWPAQIEDCYGCYCELLEMGYKTEDMVFMGESAGGTLVLSLALLAKQKGLPLPAAVIALSPATSQVDDLPSHTGNISTDYMLRDAVAAGICDVLFEKPADREVLKDPLLSPYYGDYEGLPPVFLSASDSETLYDDAVILYDKLKAEGHETLLVTEHGLCHAYQIMTYMPEARKTLKACFEAVDKWKTKR